VPNEDQVYIVLHHPQEICLQGKYSIKTLIGGVSILGYDIREDAPSLEVFSPENSSHLVVKTISAATSEDRTEGLASEIKSKETLEKVQAVLNEHCVLIQLNKLNCSVCDKVGMVKPFRSLFPYRKDTGEWYDFAAPLLHIDVGVADEWTRRCDISLEYEQVAEAITAAIQNEMDAPPVVVVCGGINVGKSTLGRYLINTALNR
jgi:hypothetical protein